MQNLRALLVVLLLLVYLCERSRLVKIKKTENAFRSKGESDTLFFEKKKKRKKKSSVALHRLFFLLNIFRSRQIAQISLLWLIMKSTNLLFIQV